MTDRRQDVGEESAEADRWVADALTNARDWFPSASDADLREPLEHAFRLAGEVGRGEREFHEVFEAELRRAVEERDVLGVGGSVLPASSTDAPKTFPAFAVAAEKASEPEPIVGVVERGVAEPAEAELGVAEPGVFDAAAVEPEEVDPEAVEEETVEPAVASSAEGERVRMEEERARMFVLDVAALRFLEDRAPDEIQALLGIDAAYYAESMRWLLHQVDRALAGDYPAHLDRDRMARFSAGFESIEDRFAVERHVRACEGCASYLADLRRGVAEVVERRELGTGEAPSSPPASVTYTGENAWIRFGRSHPQRHEREPVMSIVPAELERYARTSQRSSAEVSTEQPTAVERRRASGGDEVRRSAGRRGRKLVPLSLAVTVVAIVGLVLAALSGGGDEGIERAGKPSADERSQVADRRSDDQRTRREGATDTARERAEQRARHARAERRTRARREARERRAERAAKRRRDQRERASVPPAATPVEPVAPVPAPSVPSTPAPSAAPAPSAPPPSNPSGEFGLE